MLKRLPLQSALAQIFLLAFASISIGQSLPEKTTDHTEPCGFDQIHKELMLSNAKYRQRTEAFDKLAKDYVIPKVTPSTLVIPVVVHVMESGNGLTDITDQQIRDGIKTLNERYRKVPGSAGDGNGVDVTIEFALAVRDPSGNCTNGIVRYDLSGNGTYASQGVYRQSAGITDASLKSFSVWNQTQYYNIWLVSEIDDNNGGSGIQGYAYFASSHGSSVDGAVILANNFKDYNSTTGAHEIGHALNLYHTFEGDGTGATCPSNSNCNTQGDQVCDTPPHMRSSSDCVVGTNSCDGGSSTELFIHNYMDYSADYCQNEFTAGQRTRMIAALTVTRSSFLQSNGNMSLVPPATAGVSFVSAQSTVCTGANIQLYDMSSCIPNTFLDTTGWSGITFSWNITNGTDVYTSDLQNPLIIAPNAGVYNVTLTVTNSFGTTSNTIEGLFVVAAPAIPGCIPNSTNEGNFWNTVYNVQFNTIDNSTSMYVNAAHTDFSCTANTIVTEGLTYPISVDLQAASGTEFLRVYIDYNNNGIFEVTESVLNGSLASGTGTISGNVTIPGTAVKNTLLRMRVIGEINADVTNNERQCLSDFLVGDVEDYGVYIMPSCVAPVVTTQPSNIALCVGANGQFTVANTGTAPITYQWQISTNGGATYSNLSNGGVYSGVTTATLSLTSVTAGLNNNRYRCVITNSCGSINSNGGILTVNANPSLSLNSSSNPATCGTATGSITVGGTGTGTLNWTGTSSGSVGTGLPYTISSLTAGNYAITMTSAAGCASNVLNVTLTDPSAPEQPTISASGPLTFCDGASVTLTSSYASGNTWSTTETTQSIVVTTSGSYTVTYTDGGGCTAVSAATVVTVNPTPAAPTISASGSTDICPGTTVDLTSSSASGNVWSTTETTQTITVGTAGSYSVHFIDGNGCQSPESAPTIVTVSGVGPMATIPLVEGFSAGLPGTWTIDNVGGAATWAYNGGVGVAPSGNGSLMFDNYNNDDTPNQDEIYIQAVDLSSIVNTSMTFDVAYARYDVSYFDGLQVLVSDDCGNTFSSVYNKSNTTLATAPDNTAAFTPTAAQWRNEPIDLSAYDGTAGLIIKFRNLAGYGNRLFIDNVNITGTVLPTADFSTSTTTICETEMVSFVDMSTGSPSTYSWTFPGGSPGTSNVPNPTVTYNTAGTYDVILTVTNAAGSDTETKVGYITVNPTPAAPVVNVFDDCGFTTLSTTGSNLLWSTAETTDNITVTVAGTYSVTQTVNGCVSPTTNAIANPLSPSTGSETVTACDSYTWATNSTTYNSSGSYTAILTNAVGCDSVVTLNLTINSSSSGSESVVACDSFTWPADGNTYFSSGIYFATLTNAAGCDSLVTLNLTINNSNSGSESIVACDSYTWTANGMNYTSSGVYTANLTNAAGCDSLATLNLTINYSSTGSETVSACDSYTWTTNGMTYTTGGIYTAVLTNAAGCDSVVTLNLTLGYSNSSTETIVACDSYTWSATGTTYTVGGTYNTTLTNATGCDSLVTLNLTINNSSSGSESVTACDSYTWSADGNTYTTSGTYTAILTNAVGCDSTASLNLTINNSTSGTESITACDSYTWPANGLTYTSSGSYIATLTNAVGCDSVVTLQLTLGNSNSSTQTITACNSYTWSATGMTYTVSGTYNTTLTNVSGCDSLATLNLTITGTLSGSETATACDSYTWPANGLTYFSSGIYNTTLTSTGGCDSIVSLNLTINNSTSGSESVTACDIYTWSADGNTYFASGTYMATLTNAAGCDSIATLNLTINNSNSGTETVSACTSYTWPASGMTYSSSGVYTVLLTNASGCDSIAQLNLTINQPNSSSQSVTACDSYTWSATGMTYTSGGVYNAVLTNVSGCDSTVTLNLTINNSTSGSETITACGSYTWSATGLTYTVDGTYNATLTGSNGCDSIATLNLTITSLPSTPIVSVNDFCGYSELTASGTNLLWSTGETSALITVTTGGSYTVTQTVGGCTSAPATITANPLTVPATPTISSNTGSFEFCEGESIVLISSSTTGNSWSNGPTSQSIVVANSGTFSVTVTNGDGCSASSSIVTTVENTLPTVTFNTLPMVCNTSGIVNLDQGSPVGGVYSGTGVSGTSFDPSIAGPGTWTIQYTYTDGNSCSASAFSDITVNDCAGLTDVIINNVEVYPNPSLGIVYVKSELEVKVIQVYDETGRLVIQEAVNDWMGEHKLYLTDHPSGVYTIQLVGDQVNKIERLILNK